MFASCEHAHCSLLHLHLHVQWIDANRQLHLHCATRNYPVQCPIIKDKVVRVVVSSVKLGQF